MLGMEMIILLSVILYCVHCCCLNFKKCPNDTRSCVVVNVSFLIIIYINQCYPRVIRIWKNSKIKAKMLKTKIMMKKNTTFIKRIKIQWYHMGVIFISTHLIWQMLQCAHIISLIMHLRTENVYCSAVPTIHLLILLTKKQIKTRRKNTLN